MECWCRSDSRAADEPSALSQVAASVSLTEPPRSVWTTRGPTEWPPPPKRMSYTTLRDIETCPLRWSLRQGTYPDAWSGTGYPPSPAGATIAGHVVHEALERIVRAVSAAREAQPAGRDAYPNTSDPMVLVVEALRALGGISAVLEGVIRETVHGWESNPRLRPRAKELASDLQRQLPALRPRVQHFLNRVDLPWVRPPVGSSAGAPGGDPQKDFARALAPGLYAEVPLINDELGWYGKADLLRVGADVACNDSEIVDFKTGLPKPDHALQLRIYALLWAREKRHNPRGRRVRKLTVLYGSGPVEVPAPITDGELDGIAEELALRTAEARAATQHHPPEARPSRSACEWCDVRHMCPAFWAPTTRGLIAGFDETPRYQVDAGVQILGKQGAWSWIARLQEFGALSDGIVVGDRVLLRARPHDVHFASLMTVDARLRILSAQFVVPSEESGGLPVLSLTRTTEAFVIMDAGAGP
jgi:hypothetical protein